MGFTDKMIVCSMVLVMFLSLTIGVKALSDLNDGRVLTVVKQLVK